MVVTLVEILMVDVLEIPQRPTTQAFDHQPVHVLPAFDTVA